MSDTFLPTPDTGAPAPTQDTGMPAAAPAPSAPVEEFEVKVNGQTLKVSRDELIKGYQRQSDYTRAMQQIAGQRQQLDLVPKYQQALREAQNFLKDGPRIAAYYQQTFGQRLDAAADAVQDQVDAGYLTPQQAQAMLAKVKEEIQSQLAGVVNEMQMKELTGTYQAQVNTTVQRALATYPAIKEALGAKAELALKQLVAVNKPQSLEETLALIDEEAKTLNDQLGGFRDATLKATIGTPNPLGRGIQPPAAGPAPGPAGTPTFKRVTDPGLRALVEQDLAAIMSRQAGS